MTAVGTTLLPSDPAQRHTPYPKGNKYNKTNVSQQIQTQRQTLEPRRAYQKRPKLFASRLLAVFSLLGSAFDFFIAEIFAWGTSDSFEETASRATYFVLNLLVHTNALLTVFRFRFHFVFSSSSFLVHHCCCSLLFAPPVVGLKFG